MKFKHWNDMILASFAFWLAESWYFGWNLIAILKARKQSNG